MILVPPISISLSLSLSSPSHTQPGDIVTVNHGNYGRREGLVIGSHIDYAVRPLPVVRVSFLIHLPAFSFFFSPLRIQGRQIVEVQFEPGDIYHAWYPSVTRVKRTIYTRPKPRTVERHVYW
jgi:hypothetical protein